MKIDFVAGLSYKMRVWSAGRLVRLHLALVRWAFHCSPPMILFRTSLQWSIWRFSQNFVVIPALRVSNSGPRFNLYSCSKSCADSLTLNFLSTSWPSQALTVVLWYCFIVCPLSCQVYEFLVIPYTQQIHSESLKEEHLNYIMPSYTHAKVICCNLFKKHDW